VALGSHIRAVRTPGLIAHGWSNHACLGFASGDHEGNATRSLEHKHAV
jgi:hypothetical protein